MSKNAFIYLKDGGIINKTTKVGMRLEKRLCYELTRCCLLKREG